MAKDINIGGRLHSIATGNVVAGADEILDDNLGKKQTQINTETYNFVKSINNALDELSPDQQEALGVATKANANEAKLGYYVCDTDADVAAKTIAATGYALTTGGNIRIKMTNTNTADAVTLNINSTGAKALFYNGAQASSTNSWKAGEVVEVYYDGTQYNALSNVLRGKNTDEIIQEDEYVVAQALIEQDKRISHLEENALGEDEERIIAEALCDLKEEKGGGGGEVGNYSVKICCMGDSITSNQQSNMGAIIREILKVTYLKEATADADESIYGNVTSEFGNLACSNAHFVDQNGTTEQVAKHSRSAGVDNTLSNQVRRLLQHTAPLGEQITWSYGSTTYSIDTSIGVGKGYTHDIPDIIYIAMGTNDGVLTDDLSEVMAQGYSELTRRTIPSAMRWAVETLHMAYPLAQIYFETPPCNSWGAYDTQNERAELIKKCAKRLHVQIVDAFNECGQSSELISLWTDGAHPNNNGKTLVGQYVAGKIKTGFGKLI